MFGIFKDVFWLQSLVSFYLNNIFFYDPNIFTIEHIYHYVEQMSLNNIFFGYDIWTEPSNSLKTHFGSKKSKK